MKKVTLCLLAGLVVFTAVVGLFRLNRSIRNNVNLSRIPFPSKMVIETKSVSPVIALLHNFLSPGECDHLIRLTHRRMRRSGIQTSEGSRVRHVRTSYSGFLRRSEDEIVRRIEERASRFCKSSVDHSEPLQVVRYEKGQYYRLHYDFFVPDADGTIEALKRGGQRTVTFFVYLNDLPDDATGGETHFPRVSNLKIRPKRGTAAFWNNVKADGEEDYRTYHAGIAPSHGVKYGLNIWFRERRFS